MVVDKQNAGAHGSLDSPYKQQQQVSIVFKNIIFCASSYFSSNGLVFFNIQEM